MALALTVGATLLSLLGLAAFGLAGWPGAANHCIAAGTCFCEAFREGLVRQPANTWSNLGFVAVGLSIAAHVDRRPALAPRRTNPMTTTRFYPTSYALVIALLGPGSMALHASMTRWGGQVDVLSMYLFASFVLAYGVLRWRRLSRAGFLGVFATLTLLLGASKLWNPVSSDLIFGLLLASIGAVEMAVSRARPELRIERGWLLGALVVFLAAFAVWLPSRTTNGLLCMPDSLLQGHALWHLKCALATAAIFLYYRSERVEAS